jgi:hypothetical protein
VTGINKPMLDQDIMEFKRYVRELVETYKLYRANAQEDQEETTLGLCVYLVETYNVFQLASMVAVATEMLTKGGVPDVEILPGV